MKTPLLIALSLFCVSLNAQFNWEHTNGPEGGASLRLTTNDFYTFYADDYFLYRTSDLTYWEQLPIPGIYEFVGHAQSLFAEQHVLDSYGETIEKNLIISHNNGETWTECTYPDSLDYIHFMVFCTHGIYIPRGEAHQLYRSTDYGISWDILEPPLTYGYDIEEHENRIYLFSLDEIWRTDDSGFQWTNITPPLQQSGFLRSVVSEGSNIIVIGSENIWNSHDDGQTWNSTSTPWPEGYTKVVNTGLAVFALGGPSEISVSYDFGTSWTDLTGINRTFYGMASFQNQLLICSYQSGVYTWDPQSELFEPINSGLYSAPVNQMQFKDGLLWTLSGNGLFNYDPSTEVWTNKHIPQSLLQYEVLDVGSNGLVCATDGFRSVTVSVDAGQNWDVREFGIHFIPHPSYHYFYVFDNAIYIRGLAGFNETFLRSDDFGISWTPLHVVPWSYAGLEYFQNQLITGSNDTLYASTDSGDSWQMLSTIPTGIFLKFLVTEDRLFAVTKNSSNQQVLYSSNDGVLWTYSHTGLPSRLSAESSSGLYLNCFKKDAAYYLAIDDLGTFVSMDSGGTWIPVYLGNRNPYALGDTNFYTGGFGGGVFKATHAGYGALISGSVFNDNNGNGVQDPEELKLPGIRVGLLSPGSMNPFYFTTTNSIGEYSLGIIPDASDTLRPAANYIESVSPSYYLTDSPETKKDFGIHFIPNINSLSIYSHLGLARPGFDLTYTMTYLNEGTTTQDAVVYAKIDPALEFIHADPQPTLIVGDSLMWQIDQFPMLNSGRIVMRLHVPNGTPIGTELQQVCYILSDQTDLTPDDNSHSVTRIVVGSYDPNAKEVNPPEGLTEKEIAEGKELLYTIQFQNTGNYPAEKVRITDMIDTALYLPTIRLVGSSHEITEFSLNPGGLLEIVFDNIQLPDSISNEPESHGFVTFAVKRKTTFSKTEPVLNRAGIYFDFNHPIFTNEVAFTVRPDAVSVNDVNRSKESLTIYPNPTTGEVYITAPSSSAIFETLGVYDINGRIVKEVSDIALSGKKYRTTLDLSSGIYVIVLRGSQGAISGRVLLHR